MKKIDFKKGSGEALAFCCIIPFIAIMIFAILSATQIDLTKKKLDYCAYNACRSAVVSDSYTAAQEHANQIYALSLGSENAAYYGYTPCSLEIVDGGNWVKGAYVKCTVQYYIETSMPFTSGIRESTIIMMIENNSYE